MYGNPSNKLIVIGVTGTKGKSSTTQMMAQLLTAMGHKVGYTGTAGFSVAGMVIENKMKMTMPGRFVLQRLLRQMVQAGCEYALIETSSQGLVQYRHLGINYDTAVFTNLSPEHIEAHGGFAAYRAAKKLLFTHLSMRAHKIIDGVKIDKVIVTNGDDEAGEFYADAEADKKCSFAWHGLASASKIVPTKVGRDAHGLRMTIDHVDFAIPLLAEFEQQNALCAVATLAAMGISLSKLAVAAKGLKSIAGRFERIDCGQPFTVIVDYAYEPKAIEMLLRSVEPLKPAHIIGVHGSAGGGRDVARREKIGRLAGEKETLVIVTNEDPYDDSPEEIVRMVADGARAVGKIDGQNLFVVMDRQEAIDEAVRRASTNDVVLITGKGSEPVMAVAGGVKIPWDDRESARMALAKIGYKV